MTRCLLTACNKLFEEPFCPAALMGIKDLKEELETRFAAVEKILATN